MRQLHHTRTLPIILICLALLPRVLTLGRGLTTDEAYHWVTYRSGDFLSAVTEGRFADTMITGHPGITTMWLGSAGLLIEQFFQNIGVLATPTFETHLTLMRLPMAVVTSLAVGAGYLLLRRILGGTIALIAAFLWATDPFLIAHSRLLHLDALLTMVMLLATLALLAACFSQADAQPHPHMPLLVLAGIATGLALVTKSLSVLLLPVAMLILLTWWIRGKGGSALARGAEPVSMEPLRVSTQHTVLLRAALSFLLSTALTAFLVWPALWVAPWQAVASVVNEVIANGGTPQKGNFLLGTNFLTDAPGVLFYPVTLFARLTPWVVVGLLACIVASLRTPAWLHSRRIPLLLLTTAALLLPLVLTIPPKKFDRYALPALPLLHILSATGLSWIGLHLPVLPRRVLASLTLLVALATLAAFHPYYLSWYNPLIGGSASAVNLVPIGWGEGLDLAADWLNQQPDITRGRVATWSPPTLQAYLHTPATWQGDITNGQVSYMVVYINQVQTGKESQYFGAIHTACQPVHTVQMHDIVYAHIYRVPMFTPRLSAPVRFGTTLSLQDSILVPPAPCSDEPFTLTLVFEPLTAPAQPLFLFLHAIGPDGKVLQVDLPLSSLIPPETWQTGKRVPYTIQLPLPAAAPVGDYQILLGLYDITTGTRLPAQSITSHAPPLVGSDTVQVATFEHLEDRRLKTRN